MRKKVDYAEIQRLAECLKTAAVTDEKTIESLYGVKKEEAIKNIIKAIEEAAK